MNDNVKRLAVANGPNIFQMLSLLNFNAFRNARANSEGSQIRRVQKDPKVNLLPQQHPFGDHKMNASLIIPTLCYRLTNDANLVKFGLVLYKIFVGIYADFSHRQK